MEPGENVYFSTATLSSHHLLLVLLCYKKRDRTIELGDLSGIFCLLEKA